MLDDTLDNFNKIISKKVKIYGSRESIRSQLTEFAQEYLELKAVDLYKTSFLSYIIDILSILTANQMFYTSSIYKEFFFVTAQFNESVSNLANWIGYKPPQAIPSRVDVVFELPLTFSSAAVTFSIPSEFKVTASHIPFMIDSNPISNVAATFERKADNEGKALEISATVLPDTTVQIINNNAVTVRDSNGFYRPVTTTESRDKITFALPFIQHEKINEQFIIPTSLEFYQFYSKKVKFNGMVSQIKVFIKEPIGGETLNVEDSSSYNFNEFDEWVEAENGLYTLTSVSKQFVWTSTINEGELHFGNGILGRQPAPGSIIMLSLYITKGSDGKVIPMSISKGDPLYYKAIDASTGSLTNVSTKLHRISYKVYNPSMCTGGSNTPNNEEIKQNAIVNLRSKKRLVSGSDYYDINTIMGSNFPVSEATPILKRSDIKINEIMTFMKLMYHDSNNLPEIVPTRNAYVSLLNVVYNRDGKFTIPRKSKLIIDNNIYESIFNITLNQRTNVATYDYVLSDVYDSPAALTIDQPYNISALYIGQSYIPITTVDFHIPMTPVHDYDFIEGSISSSAGDNSSSSELSSSTEYIEVPSEDIRYPLIIKINVDHIPSAEISFFRIKAVTRWGSNQEYIGDDIIKPDINFSTDINVTYNNFTLTIPDYREVPVGLQRIEYEVHGLVFDEASGEDTWIPLHRYFTDVVIRQNLDDVMISTMTSTRRWDGICHDDTKTVIHNVPVILSNYIDDGAGGGVINTPNQKDFELTVIQNLLNNLYMDNKRMLTDFINVKVPDTHGKFYNLKYNKQDHEIVSRYQTPFGFTAPAGIKQMIYTIYGNDNETLNPGCQGDYYDSGDTYNDEPIYRQNIGTFALFYTGSTWVISDTIDSAEIGYRWVTSTPSIITGTYNAMTSTDGKVTSGVANIKHFEFDLSAGSKYIINSIDPNHHLINRPELIGYIAGRTAFDDWIIIEPIRDMYVSIKDEYDINDDNQVVVWTGKNWKNTQDFDIPMKIYARIRVSNVSNVSNDALIADVKEKLLEYFAPKFGVNKTLDRSEIIRVIRGTEFVTYCDLISPEVDIRYTYSLKDLSEKQLLDYTPQYVGFTEDTIHIDILR